MTLCNSLGWADHQIRASKGVVCLFPDPRPVESESAHLQMEFHQLTLTSCHMWITWIQSVKDLSTNLLLDKKCLGNLKQMFPVSSFYCHCLLTALPWVLSRLIRSWPDKSHLVKLWRSCGWMNDLGKEGICGSSVLDLSCILNVVILHTIPDTQQGFGGSFSSVLLEVHVHCGIGAAFLSLVFLFLCERGQRQPVLSPPNFLIHLHVPAANPFAYTMSTPRFTSYLSDSSICFPRVNTACFLEHHKTTFKHMLMKEQQILTITVYFTYQCSPP